MDKYFAEKFRKIPEHQVNNGFKLNLSNFKFMEKENQCYIKTIEDFIYLFNGSEKIQYNVSTGKLFMYAISNLIEGSNVSRFYLKSYIRLRGFTKIGNGVTQLKQDLEQLLRIEAVAYQDGKDWGFFNIICSAKKKGQYVIVEFNKDFVENLRKMYFWIPNSLFRTKDRYAPHAWSIGYELFRYIKNNINARHKNTFRRNIRNLVKYSDFQSLSNIKRLKESFYTPFVKSVEHLNTIQKFIYIEIPEYHPDFKSDFVNVKVIDDCLLDLYKSSMTQKIKQSKRNKFYNVAQAKEMKFAGYTHVEIANKLSLSVRTITNYLNS